MKKIYTHENGVIVENARNILEQNGFEVWLKNRYASSGLGELPAFDIWPELWVPEAQVADAKVLLNSIQQPSTGIEWKCPSCGEPNGDNFFVCWNCEREKPKP